MLPIPAGSFPEYCPQKNDRHVEERKDSRMGSGLENLVFLKLPKERKDMDFNRRDLLISSAGIAATLGCGISRSCLRTM